jgi:pimeloyl-ACP methyl ester carboxylesterase
MREVGIDAALGRIAGLRNDGRGPRVLALHGWLDNAASFLPMAPYLRDIDLVALDLPGHGRSAHLTPGAEYSFSVAIAAVLDAADALGWDRFHLLGHSMGAGIASLVASACPERVERLVAIEMLGALAEPPTQAAARLREAVAAQRTIVDKRLRVFPDIDTAVRARLHAGRVPGSGLDAERLRLLVERGVRAVPGGFVWSSDPRLTLPSLMRYTQAQVDDILAAIACPTLAVFADPAQPYLPDEERRRRVGLLAQGRLLALPGGHHLHMQQPAPVAAAVVDFFAGE